MKGKFFFKNLLHAHAIRLKIILANSRNIDRKNYGL